jgi:predicted metalloprotease with PDZ domain
MKLHPWILLASFSAAACGPAPKGPETGPPKGPGPTAATAAETAAPASHVLSIDTDLEITLRPESSPRGLVRVTVAARPDEAGLGTWQSPGAIDFIDKPTASDEAGRPIEVTVEASGGGGGGTRVTLAQRPPSATWLTYTVRAELPAYPDPPAVTIDPDRFEAAGESLLLLPSTFEERSLRASLRIETDEIGTAELTGAASSFGLGQKVQTTARGGDLRDAFFLAGLIGRATFLAPEGHDDAAWLGYTAFDPRPVVADMAGFRTALRQLFGAPDAEKVTFLFLSDTRPEGTFVVSRRPRSVIARVGVQERWGAPLRIAVAVAVVHGWIGSRLWIGPSDPAHEAEAYWFTEGVSRHLARDLLFRFGLISAAEMALEVEGLASVLATSPLAALPNVELGKKPKAAIPLLVARGALYALRIDALLREKTQKKRSLDNLLRELYTRAAAEKGALPASAWLDAIAKDLGEGERAAFRDAIDLGKPFDLPDGAIGPCFRRVTRSYTGFELGFDEEATSKSAPSRIVGLVPGGPAEKAGLHEGDPIVSLAIGRRSPSEPINVTIGHDEKTKKITYKPEGKRSKGFGFERKKDVADDACTP